MQNINKDLVNFILDEIKDHVAQLVELAQHQDPDYDAAEYHSEKVRSMVGLLKEAINSPDEKGLKAV